MTFVLRLNLSSSCIIRCESKLFMLLNTAGILRFNLTLIDNTTSMCRTSIFFSEVTLITYFNINIKIIIITDLKFNRVFKIFIIFFSHHKFFVKMFFHHITTLFTFLNHTANEIMNSIFA